MRNPILRLSSALVSRFDFSFIIPLNSPKVNLQPGFLVQIFNQPPVFPLPDTFRGAAHLPDLRNRLAGLFQYLRIRLDIPHPKGEFPALPDTEQISRPPEL